jgi:hypothetical protein
MHSDGMQQTQTIVACVDAVMQSWLIPPSLLLLLLLCGAAFCPEGTIMTGGSVTATCTAPPPGAQVSITTGVWADAEYKSACCLFTLPSQTLDTAAA